MLKKSWQNNLPWPKPLSDGNGMAWECEDAEISNPDSEAEELLEIRRYFDGLVECGRLNEDYTLNEDYEAWPDEEDSEDDEEFGDEAEFVPEIGEDYWDGESFALELLEEDLSDHMNLLKIEPVDPEKDPVSAVREATGYDFVNENLLRQAFTARSFAVEYGLSGNCEELEFLGDSILNLVVTKEITNQLSEVNPLKTEAPFVVQAIPDGKDDANGSIQINEGILSRIRERYVCREYLAARAERSGLDRFILIGSSEQLTEERKEDMVEALLAAVALDCGWKWETIEEVADRLLCIQLSYPDRFLKKSYYDMLNAWHQKHFGEMPSYEVYGQRTIYCTLRYFAPENDQGIAQTQRIDTEGETRSEARENAAKEAYRFLMQKGLWKNLKEAKLAPDMDNSINQLQELYQKGYLEERPTYEFEEQDGSCWYCSCICDGLDGFGRAGSKTRAKKKASYMLLIRLLDSAGICKKEWRDAMYHSVMDKDM